MTTGVTQDALSDIETGRVPEPSQDIIEEIARATQFPPSFFYLGALPALPEGYYRRLARGTSKEAKQMRAWVRHVIEVIQRGERSFRLPRVSLQTIDQLSGLEEIENLAIQIRGALGVGDLDPIPNMAKAAERLGIIVVRLPGELKDHDSYSSWPDYGLGGRPIIALTAGHPGDRDRFNVGHELAHLILHTTRVNIMPKQAEDEANRMAGALLFPKSAAREAMHPPVTLRVLMGVKATYGISIAAGARRALDLKLINRDQFISIRKQISARRWRIDEPVEVLSEKPTLAPMVIAAMAGEGSTSQKAKRVSMQLFAFQAVTSS